MNRACHVASMYAAFIALLSAVPTVYAAPQDTFTLANERIPSLNWPPMVMAFAVRDKSLLDKAQAGKKVEFEFVQQSRDNVITSVK